METMFGIPAARLVQEHDFATILLQDGSREEEELLLPVAQHVLFKGSVKTAPGVYGGPEIDCMEGVDYGFFGIRCRGVDVLADGPREDELVLRHGDEARAKGFAGDGVEWDGVDGERSGGWVEEAEEG